MRHTSHRVIARGFTVTIEDVGVVTVGVAAATHEWWYPIIKWVPDILQGFVLCATVVFVAARAVNEVRKLLRKD